jgi:hypothetical protein
VRASGPIDIELKASEREQVTVHFDDNLAALIETRVVQDSAPTLDIRINPTAGFRSSKPPRVTVEFRTLSALRCAGRVMCARPRERPDPGDRDGRQWRRAYRPPRC